MARIDDPMMDHVPGPDDDRLVGDFRTMAETFARLLREDDERENARAAIEAEERREADEHRAARARAGEMGAEWRTVQSRIDLGETSLEAVFRGEDQTSAAQALRKMSSENLRALRESWNEVDDDVTEDDDRPSPDAEFDAAVRQSHERYTEALAKIRDALELARRDV